jgi:hypothetical protein
MGPDNTSRARVAPGDSLGDILGLDEGDQSERDLALLADDLNPKVFLRSSAHGIYLDLLSR